MANRIQRNSTYSLIHICVTQSQLQTFSWSWYW